MDADQLHYLKTVLGLSNVLLPFSPTPVHAHTPVETKGALQLAKLIVLLPLGAREFPLHGPLEDLVDRMIKAMKLEPAEVYRAQWPSSVDIDVPPEITELVAQAAGRPVLIFGDQEAQAILPRATMGQWTELDGARTMVTFSPRDLLSSNENKRLAWVHLQQVMRVLSK